MQLSTHHASKASLLAACISAALLSACGGTSSTGTNSIVATPITPPKTSSHVGQASNTGSHALLLGATQGITSQNQVVTQGGGTTTSSTTGAQSTGTSTGVSTTNTGVQSGGKTGTTQGAGTSTGTSTGANQTSTGTGTGNTSSTQSGGQTGDTTQTGNAGQSGDMQSDSPQTGGTQTGGTTQTEGQTGQTSGTQTGGTQTEGQAGQAGQAGDTTQSGSPQTGNGQAGNAGQSGSTGQTGGTQNDGTQNDGTQNDGTQNDGTQNDGTQNDGTQNDSSQTPADPSPNTPKFTKLEGTLGGSREARTTSPVVQSHLGVLSGKLGSSNNKPTLSEDVPTDKATGKKTFTDEKKAPGVKIYMLDPKSLEGLEYSTYGQVTKDGKSLGFVSFGLPWALPEKVEQPIVATYQGRADGHYEGQNFTGKMSAKLNWGVDSSDRNLQLTVNDMKPSSDQAVNKNLDFTETLQWSVYANTKNFSFQKDGVRANLYGQDGAEVGGVFKRTVDDKPYEGAFGGTRTK